MKEDGGMWESIKQLVENGNYLQAKQELDKEKAVSGCPDDLFAVLDANKVLVLLLKIYFAFL